MTDKLVSAEQERLLEIVEDLLDSQSSFESDLEWILGAMKNNCKLLPEKLQGLPFISCIIKGKGDPNLVLETAREFLYADLISTLNEDNDKNEEEEERYEFNKRWNKLNQANKE